MTKEARNPNSQCWHGEGLFRASVFVIRHFHPRFCLLLSDALARYAGMRKRAKEMRNPKSENEGRITSLRILSLVIFSSFIIRHSSFLLALALFSSPASAATLPSDGEIGRAHV